MPLVCRTGCRQPGISCFCSLQSPPPFLPGCLLPSLRAQLGIPFLRNLHIPGGGGMPPQSPSSWQSGYTIHSGGLRPAGAPGPIELCLPRWTAVAAQGKSHLRLFFFFFSASEISHLIYLETFMKHLLISSGTRNSMKKKSVHKPCAQHFRAYGERRMFSKVSTDKNISI